MSELHEFESKVEQFRRKSKVSFHVNTSPPNIQRVAVRVKYVGSLNLKSPILAFMSLSITSEQLGVLKEAQAILYYWTI